VVTWAPDSNADVALQKTCAAANLHTDSGVMVVEQPGGAVVARDRAGKSVPVPPRRP